jgi:hypothetical protein
MLRRGYCQAILLLALFSMRGRTQSAVPIALGQSVVALNGPWKFHTGDDSAWAEPGFDDSSWETVDLTPPAGAHDPDVGLTGYVRGWRARGHPGYSGFAWYRMRVTVAADSSDSLAISGPLQVDDAYQLFADGRFLGASGRFDGTVPVVSNTRPQRFALPVGQRTVNLAIRVWLAPRTLGRAPDDGGIRIAPAIGLASAIDARYRDQWLQKFLGYVVDAVEPIAFVLLAVMAIILIAFDPSDPAYKWLAAALLLTALVRENQAVFFWTTLYSLKTFAFVKVVLLFPLVMAAWTMAWRAWLRLDRPRMLPQVVGVLTLLYIAAQWLVLHLPRTAALTFQEICVGARLLFVLITMLIIYQAVRQGGTEAWLALPAILFAAIAMFAQELSDVGVPGIWFPFGIGVSRTQFAYVPLMVALFVMLLRRYLHFAQNSAKAPSVHAMSAG